MNLLRHGLLALLAVSASCAGEAQRPETPPGDSIRPFKICVDESVLADLRGRLNKTRMPDALEGAGWDTGVQYESSHPIPYRPSQRPPRSERVPVGVALFPKEIHLPPRKWVEKNYNLVHWTEMPRGGHFAAMEEPQLFVEDVRTFFRKFR